MSKILLANWKARKGRYIGIKSPVRSPFENRENAARLLADAEAGQIEEVEVHSIDRLGRDAINVLHGSTFLLLQMITNSYLRK